MKSHIILVLSLISSGLLIISLISDFPIKIIYNPSRSAPIGFYFIEQKQHIKRGDYILLPIPKAVRELAIKRRYVGSNTPLLKKVFAISGDHICVNNGQIYVNYQPVVKIKTHDPSGRKMPIWKGCGMLNKDEYFLLSLHSKYSFDSRYFGPIMKNKIIGVATYF